MSLFPCINPCTVTFPVILAPAGIAAMDEEPLTSDAKVKVPLLVKVAAGASAITAFNDAVSDAAGLITEVPPRLIVPGPLMVAVDAATTARLSVTVKVWFASMVKAGVLFVPNLTDPTVVPDVNSG